MKAEPDEFDEARAAMTRAVDALRESFRTHGPWAQETLDARRRIYTAAGMLSAASVYRPESSF